MVMKILQCKGKLLLVAAVTSIICSVYLLADFPRNEVNSSQNVILGIRLFVKRSHASDYALILSGGPGTGSYRESSSVSDEVFEENFDVGKDEYQSLSQLLVQNRYWEFEGEYTSNITDETEYWLGVMSIAEEHLKSGADAQENSVRCYSFESCPSEVIEVIKEIKGLYPKKLGAQLEI